MMSDEQATYPFLAQMATKARKPIWLFDLEATNGDLSDPQFGIVEIGWVRIDPDGKVTEKSLWLNPGFPMNHYAAKITGIKTSDYRQAPTLQESWTEIWAHMENSLSSGFGIHDLDCRALFLESSKFLGDEASLGRRIHTLDARKVWIDHSGSSKGQLSEVAKHFGHTGTEKHRALADARMAASVLEGLAAAQGIDYCLSRIRSSWNPTEAHDKQKELAQRDAQDFAVALALVKDCGSFEKGCSELDQAGFRSHFSNKGFTWWRGTARVKLDGAPDSPLELAQHFGTKPPEFMAIADSLDRCQAVMSIPGHHQLNDETIANLALCRSEGSASAARARAIRLGQLPPWIGIDPALALYAKSLSPLPADERAILEALRASIPTEHRGSPAVSSCAASLAQEAQLPYKLHRKPAP